MNRAAWRAMHRNVRAQSNCPRPTYASRGVSLERIMHGSTYWNVRAVREYGKATVLTVEPSIIRDRSPFRRIADDLAWARYFRKQAGYLWADKGKRARDIAAARGCIADARQIPLAASPFNRLP
jgi:hypothetical protein